MKLRSISTATPPPSECGRRTWSFDIADAGNQRRIDQMRQELLEDHVVDLQLPGLPIQEVILRLEYQVELDALLVDVGGLDHALEKSAARQVEIFQRRLPVDIVL